MKEELRKISSICDHNIGPNVKMKAAGGIYTPEDAGRFMEPGVSRIGTGRIVKESR